MKALSLTGMVCLLLLGYQQVLARYAADQWRTSGPFVEMCAVAVDPMDHRVLFAGSCGFGGGLGIYKSIDNGLGWARVGPTTTPQIWELEIDPQNQQAVYAGTYGEGILKSIDGGNSWTQVHYAWLRSLEIAPSNPSTIYVLGDRLHVSRTSGASWVTRFLPWKNGEWAQLDVHPTDSSVIYMYSNDYWNAGVLKSVDGGETIYMTNGQPDTTCGQIKIDPAEPLTVYCVSDYQPRIYVTRDGGTIWDYLAAPGVVRHLAIDPLDGNIFYAALESGGVYRSFDRGASWTSYSSGLGAAVRELELDGSGQFLHAATVNGVYSVMVRQPSWGISGRVFGADGRGLANVRVYLSSPSGVPKTTTTSSFGYYSFENTPEGDYTISVASRRFRFTPRPIQLINNLTDVDLIGQE